jgi:hypothetical protein
VTLEEAYPRAVDFVLREKLMEYSGEDTLRLTPSGCDHKNGVHALFYAPSIQRYLLSRDPEQAGDFERHRKSARRLAEEPVPA